MDHARARFTGQSGRRRFDQTRLEDRLVAHHERAVGHGALQILERPRGFLVAQEPTLVVEQPRVELHRLSRLQDQLGGRDLQVRRPTLEDFYLAITRGSGEEQGLE